MHTFHATLPSVNASVKEQFMKLNLDTTQHDRAEIEWRLPGNELQVNTVNMVLHLPSSPRKTDTETYYESLVAPSATSVDLCKAVVDMKLR